MNENERKQTYAQAHQWHDNDEIGNIFILVLDFTAYIYSQMITQNTLVFALALALENRNSACLKRE